MKLVGLLFIGPPAVGLYCAVLIVSRQRNDVAQSIVQASGNISANKGIYCTVRELNEHLNKQSMPRWLYWLSGWAMYAYLTAARFH